MNQTMAIAIVGVFIVAASPGIQAATETHSAEYDVPSSTNGNPPYVAVSTRVCAPEWDEGILVAPEDDAAFAPAAAPAARSWDAPMTAS